MVRDFVIALLVLVCMVMWFNQSCLLRDMKRLEGLVESYGLVEPPPRLGGGAPPLPEMGDVPAPYLGDM